MNYIETIDNKIKDYFKILEPNYPDWLNSYINTKELLKQKDISVTCGTIYSNLFDNNFFFSSLDHSIAVALIIWHFTKDKKQTLSGLFHDIATPSFKHCVDFMEGDYMTQESTEELTHHIIVNSKEIMTNLKKDGIKINEVDNYHIYPIADNNTPNLSADRLEYSLSNALLTYNLANLDTIREIYNDISKQNDENGVEELGFNDKEIALKFVELTSKLSIIYREDRTRFSMQFIADILKCLNKEGIILKEDLYTLNEMEIIKIILKSKYKDVFESWIKARKVLVSKEEPQDVYYVHHGAKVRYIDPLVQEKRISNVDVKAKKLIKTNLSYNMNNYVFLDFKINRDE